MPRQVPMDFLLAQHVYPPSSMLKNERHTKVIGEATAQHQRSRMDSLFIKNLSQLINRVLLSSVDPVPDHALHGRPDLLVAVEQVDPAVLDALGLEQRGRDLRHGLAAHLAPAGLGLAQLDLPRGVRGQRPRPQVDPDKVAAAPG